MSQKEAHKKMEMLLKEANSSDYENAYSAGSDDTASKLKFESWFRRSANVIQETFADESEPSRLMRKAEKSKEHFNIGSFAFNLSTGFGAKPFEDCVVIIKQALKEGLYETRYDLLENRHTRIVEKTDVKKVFLVHGHHGELKEKVARFIEKLGLEPIILHEQASGGSSTIIEKIENHSEVAYALVLLTPDDVGAQASTVEAVSETGTGKLNYRARQNVVMELGYFMGKLGRNRVTALHKGSIELPSDYGGVVYIPTNENKNWKLMLARELREVGIEVDMGGVL